MLSPGPSHVPQHHPVSLAVLALVQSRPRGSPPSPVEHLAPHNSWKAEAILHLCSPDPTGFPNDPGQENGFQLSPSPTGHTDLCSLVPGAKGILPTPAATLGPTQSPAEGDKHWGSGQGQCREGAEQGEGRGAGSPGISRERAHTGETLNLCSLFAAWFPRPLPRARGPEEVVQQ